MCARAAGPYVVPVETDPEEENMPLYMDVHNLGEGLTADAVAQAHQADLRTQSEYDVRYLRYWVDEAEGKVFCLVEAPDPEAANTVHREAHGLVADELHEVQEGS
jgi:uncharacterized protein DUF4242